MFSNVARCKMILFIMLFINNTLQERVKPISILRSGTMELPHVPHTITYTTYGTALTQISRILRDHNHEIWPYSLYVHSKCTGAFSHQLAYLD